MGYEPRDKKLWVTFTRSEHDILRSEHLNAGYKSANDWVHKIVKQALKRYEKRKA